MHSFSWSRITSVHICCPMFIPFWIAYYYLLSFPVLQKLQLHICCPVFMPFSIAYYYPLSFLALQKLQLLICCPVLMPFWIAYYLLSFVVLQKLQLETHYLKHFYSWRIITSVCINYPVFVTSWIAYSRVPLLTYKHCSIIIRELMDIFHWSTVCQFISIIMGLNVSKLPTLASLPSPS